MDGELVNSSLSEEGSDNKSNFASLYFHTKVFNEMFPYYLSIGMTYEQYWEKDSSLVKAYRKAEELRKQRKNEEAWLQGIYIYDALLRVSPVFHDFQKKGTKPKPYMEEPLPITKDKVKESKAKKEKAKSNKGLRYMQAMMASYNRKFKERK